MENLVIGFESIERRKGRKKRNQKQQQDRTEAQEESHDEVEETATDDVEQKDIPLVPFQGHPFIILSSSTDMHCLYGTNKFQAYSEKRKAQLQVQTDGH